jgi:hypothetical protein
MGPQGTQGSSGPQGPAGPAGPSDAFVANQTANVTLGGPGGPPQPIVSLSLPAGSYVLNGFVNGQVVGPSPQFAQILCDVENTRIGNSHVGPGTPLTTDVSYTAALFSLQPGVSPPERIISAQPMVGAFTLADPDTVSLWCAADNAITLYNGTMTAVRVSTLTTQP